YLGFDATPFPAARGGALTITHYFEAKEAPGPEWQLFVHLQVGPDFVNADHVPLGGLHPVSAWRAGDVIPDRHTVTIPDAPGASKIDVLVGLWNAAGRMPIDDPRFDDGQRPLRAGEIPLASCRGAALPV